MDPKTDPQIGSARAWFIFCLGALSFGYAFFQRVAPSVMVPDLMAQFSIDASVIGTLFALYFYPYVVMQVPLGALLDRLGARVLLTVALAIGGLGSILFGMADTLAVAFAGRIMIGIGSAVGFLGTLALAGRWFPPHRFALLSGLVMFSGMMSGILAQGPLAGFVDAFGWRTAMWSLGGFSMLLSLTIFLFVRNAPENAKETGRSAESWSDMWKGLANAASRLEVWKVALVASTMSGPMLAIGALWGTPYLVEAYNLEKTEAASLMSLLLFGWAFGAPFSGWLSDRIKKRKALLIIGSAVLMLSTGAVAFLPSPPLWFTISMMILMGVSGAAMTVTFALARENSSASISGSVTGIVNSMTVASGAVLQPGVGFILDHVWNGQTHDNIPVYAASDYQAGFILVFATVVLGFLISLTLKESPFAKQ